jgi:serine/threonine protein kinase
VDDLLGATGGGGTRKVLKVLLANYPQAVSLFQREAKILTLLEHPGIPKVEPEGYFTFWPQDSQEPLHCLVMEKIEGINLKEWLRNQNNQPIMPEQAIAWLKQLAEILIQIHRQHYLHRDIKPSNIMLQPNGRLVLIDFGAVREATETYLQKLEGRGGTVIISPGYTPPEQVNGRAVLQSDFYALGRTFVHLLTGEHPLDLSKHPLTGELGELAWASSAPQVSQRLADLIDRLMAPLLGNRPKNAQQILHRLNEIERSSNQPKTRSTWRFSMLTPKQPQMYAIRLKPGTYRPPMAAGMYVAHSALLSQLRFTPDIQTARTWASYQQAYSYLDENLYGMAEVVPVVSIHSLLADINKLGDNGATVGIPQLTEVDKKPTSTELPFGKAEASLQHQQPQFTTQQDRKPPLPQGTTLNLEGSSSSEPDDTLYLYRLYHISELPLVSGEPLAEEWGTVAGMSEVNTEAIQQGFIWVKVQE